MYSFIFFFTSYPVFFSVTCSDLSLMSIVQVAFVNPLINEVYMYVCMAKLRAYMVGHKTRHVIAHGVVTLLTRSCQKPGLLCRCGQYTKKLTL